MLTIILLLFYKQQLQQFLYKKSTNKQFNKTNINMGNQCEVCTQQHTLTQKQQILSKNSIQSGEQFYDVQMPINDNFFVSYIRNFNLNNNSKDRYKNMDNRMSNGHRRTFSHQESINANNLSLQTNINADTKQNENEKKVNQRMKVKKNFNMNRYYYGDWRNGLPQGRGILYQPNKLLIDSNFQAGIPSGKSYIIFIDKNSTYQGQLQNSQINGFGTMQNNTQMYKFQGQWKNSTPYIGVLTLFNDINIQKVQFKNYQKNIGKIYYKDQRIYQGQLNFHKLIPQGKGIVKFATSDHKDYYQGEWKKGIYDGYGQFYWKNGQFYRGYYSQGIKNGRGKYKFITGNQYDGVWFNGKQDGYGVIYDKNGFIIKQGQWKSGNYIGPDRFSQTRINTNTVNNKPYSSPFNQGIRQQYSINNQNTDNNNLQAIISYYCPKNEQQMKRTQSHPRISKQLTMDQIKKKSYL